jgi:hypothetical protein
MGGIFCLDTELARLFYMMGEGIARRVARGFIFSILGELTEPAMSFPGRPPEVWL